MDYTGLDARNLRYKVNRPLSEAEKANRLYQRVSSGVEPNYYLSAIRVNSTFLELIDRWYPIKGFNVWLGCMLGAILVYIVSFFAWVLLFDTADLKPDEWWVPWLGWGVLIPMGLLFIFAAVWLIRSESFRYTHYPIRLNRKTRQVHVFRQDGTVLTTPWDSLFITIGDGLVPILGKTYDLRCHVLAKDATTVIESFSLGYVFAGDEADLKRLWEFVRRYMESDDGAIQAWSHAEICMPVLARKEGFKFGVTRVFVVALHWPPLQLIGCMPLSLIALGRWIAMSTSKIPRWPAEIEAVNVVADNDPYDRDWRKNPALGFFDQTWPLFCFFVGLVASITLFWWISQKM